MLNASPDRFRYKSIGFFFTSKNSCHKMMYGTWVNRAICFKHKGDWWQYLLLCGKLDFSNNMTTQNFIKKIALFCLIWCFYWSQRCLNLACCHDHGWPQNLFRLFSLVFLCHWCVEGWEGSLRLRAVSKLTRASTPADTPETGTQPPKT